MEMGTPAAPLFTSSIYYQKQAWVFFWGRRVKFSIYLFIYLFIHLSIYLFIYLFIYLLAVLRIEFRPLQPEACPPAPIF
jgi:hypothetical protein